MGTFINVLIIYNSVILGFLIILLLNFLLNLRQFKPLSSFKLNVLYRQMLPKVSVLVPARNESNDIEKCLNSLLAQDYKNMEILVLDDNSTDNTGGIVDKMIKEYNDKFSTSHKNTDEEEKISVKLLTGQALSDGWVGKNYACYQLEKAATGDYILFTDADTVHAPDSVSTGLQCLISNRLDALSAFPKMILSSLSERMVIGFLKFGILLFLPLYLRKSIKKPLFNTALGSYMLYKRSTYRAVGGHTTIYNKCLEDFNMANLLKNRGYNFAIFDGSSTYNTRMYNNFSDIYKGFSRFILTAFNYRKSLAMFLNLFMSILLLFPFLLIFIYPFINAGNIITAGGTGYSASILYTAVFLNLLQISILLLIKTIYTTRFEGNIIEVLLHPVSMGVILSMGISLYLGGKKTSSINWKGRKYSIDNSSIKT